MLLNTEKISTYLAVTTFHLFEKNELVEKLEKSQIGARYSMK